MMMNGDGREPKYGESKDKSFLISNRIRNLRAGIAPIGEIKIALFSLGSTRVSHLVILLSISKENISYPLPLNQGVPKGSVVDPLLFILYTTPLSSLISEYLIHLSNIIFMSMTLNSISFSVLDFTLNIAHLKTTIDNVSAWMSANLLSLNQSTTEFLLIGLPQQLSKVSVPTICMPSYVTT